MTYVKDRDRELDSLVYLQRLSIALTRRFS